MSTQTPSDRWKLAWLLLAVFYLVFGFLYSVIQPPTALPDERANMVYVQFLSAHHRLPILLPSGQGEAGYEMQHPPLAYGLQALVWGAFAGVPEIWRWYAVRWFMVCLGLCLLPLTARLGKQLFPDSPLARLTFAATIQLLPLTLLYFCHANPDGLGLLLSALSLLLAVQIYGDAAEPRRLPWIAGVAAALAALTKLSVLPAALVLAAAQLLRPNQTTQERFTHTAIILGVGLAGSAWWYGRNLILYHQAFIHLYPAGDMGTGLDLAARVGYGSTAQMTLTNTFLSLWAQRGWFPPSLEPFLDGGVILMVLLALAGFLFARQAPGPSLFVRWVCFLWLLFVFLGQQIAFWTVDVELNAGGRYLLAALPAIAALLVMGVARFGSRVTRVVFPLWILLILVMNIASAYNIATVLVPHYFPGWRMFEFPAQHAA